MVQQVIFFTIGLVILLFSTNKFVRISQKLSSFLRISPLVVGITVLAVGTSIPELAISIVSVSKGDVGLALGNVVGSNIVNVLFVFPISILAGKLRVGTTKTQRTAGLLLLVTVLFGLMNLVLLPPTIGGLVLTGLAVLVTITQYYMALKGRRNEDEIKISKSESQKFELKDLLLSNLLIIGVLVGSLMIVDSIENISTLTNISTTVLGLTVTAIATSLPELFASILSQKSNDEKMALGNILGNNIYNLLMIGGIVLLFDSTPVLSRFELIWLVFSGGLFYLLLRVYKDRKPDKWIAILLLVLFVIYITNS